jgi:hypothetical protein
MKQESLPKEAITYGGVVPSTCGFALARQTLLPSLGSCYFPMRVMVNLVFPDASSWATVMLISPFEPPT